MYICINTAISDPPCMRVCVCVCFHARASVCVWPGEARRAPPDWFTKGKGCFTLVTETQRAKKKKKKKESKLGVGGWGTRHPSRPRLDAQQGGWRSPPCPSDSLFLPHLTRKLTNTPQGLGLTQERTTIGAHRNPPVPPPLILPAPPQPTPGPIQVPPSYSPPEQGLDLMNWKELTINESGPISSLLIPFCVRPLFFPAHSVWTQGVIHLTIKGAGGEYELQRGPRRTHMPGRGTQLADTICFYQYWLWKAGRLYWKGGEGGEVEHKLFFFIFFSN